MTEEMKNRFGVETLRVFDKTQFDFEPGIFSTLIWPGKHVPDQQFLVQGTLGNRFISTKK